MSLRARLFGPRHCRRCGDGYVTSEHRNGFNQRTGQPIIRRWSHCPRVPGSEWGLGDGDCIPPAPWACENERRAYREHRPWQRACAHVRISQDGDRCWDKAEQQLTGLGA